MRATAKDLSGRRGNSLIFCGIGFGLAAGGGIAVSGPNGVGKSTLLRVLGGLLPAAGGRFEITDSSGSRLDVADAAHYLGHRNAMKQELTVIENLTFWKRFQAGDAEGEGSGLSVEAAVARVGLQGIGHLPFGYLSAGQQRRIALARLLTNHRPLWILDEPTAALDSQSDRLFSEIAADHLAAGGMLIAATHLPLAIDGMARLEMEPLPAEAQTGAEMWL